MTEKTVSIDCETEEIRAFPNPFFMKNGSIVVVETRSQKEMFLACWKNPIPDTIKVWKRI